jgi:hypothetical protein
MKTDKKSLMTIDTVNKKVIAKFESFKESIGINFDKDDDDDINMFSHWKDDDSNYPNLNGQYRNLGKDEEGRIIGNCKKCGANGVCTRDHECE